MRRFALDGKPIDFLDFLKRNAEHLSVDELAAIDKLNVGESVLLGGGAGADFRFARIADAPDVDRISTADLEAMAEAVHNAYLATCARLGWEVKPANRVPYVELTEESKELDRASVRAVPAMVDA